MRQDWSRTKITGFRGYQACCEGFGAPVILEPSLLEMFGSVPQDLLKVSVYKDWWCLVWCPRTGATHRVESPMLINTKEISGSTQKRSIRSCCALWMSLELRRRRGMGTSSSYLDFLFWWAPASRLISHIEVSVTVDSWPARQEEIGWSFLFTNMTELNIACLVLCVSRLWKTRIGSLCYKCDFIMERNPACHYYVYI